MLILTRNIGEIIRIGDEVSIKILEIKHNRVAIGIDAPRNMTVHRAEIYDKIQRDDSACSVNTKYKEKL